MADLSQEVEDRYGEQYLINISNPANSKATAIDSTRLELACADVRSYFPQHAQEEYDEDEGNHVATAVEGVIILLKVRSGKAKRAEWTQWVTDLDAIATEGPRARIVPVTDSLLEPTEEEAGSAPDFDRDFFNDIVPTVERSDRDVTALD